MSELEGTPEFNRQHRLLNGAGLDPYLDRPIPNQQPLNQPRDEEWEHLDGQEYEPSPHIEPDTRTGFDLNGDYHAVEFTAESINSAIGKAITPGRWCEYLQDSLVNYLATSDYTMGACDRDDFIQDIISERMENLDTMLERYQLEKALELWREKYGRSNHIRGRYGN